MDQIDLYLVSPDSLARHQLVGALILTMTALPGFALMARFSWRSWPVIFASAIGLPTIIAVLAGGALPGANWSLSEFATDVVVPLAALGLAAAAVGTAIGALARQIFSRRAT